MVRNIKILGTGMYLPERKVYNEYFVDHFNKMGLRAEGLMNHLGRRKRYLTSEKENSLTMGYEAAKDALKKSGVSAQELDMIVFVSDTPEYLMPSNALKLTDMLDAKKASIVFDLNSNCSGILYAMDVVASHLKEKKHLKKALIVGSLNISAVAKSTDTVVYPNFADGAAAVILDAVKEDHYKGLMDSESLVDTRFHRNVTFPKCGFSKISFEDIKREDKLLQWDPFDFSVITEQWTTCIRKLLERNEMTVDQINYFIFSQLSDADNLATLKRLGVGEGRGKYFFLGKEYGYTGNNCTILVLSRMWKYIAKEGTKVVFCTAGAGYTVVTLLYEF